MDQGIGKSHQKRMDLLRDFCASEQYLFSEHSSSNSLGDSVVLATTIDFL